MIYDERLEYFFNIGKSVTKKKKSFKSGSKINTVKNVIIHPILKIPAYTFEEDDSYVECSKCSLFTEFEVYNTKVAGVHFKRTGLYEISGKGNGTYNMKYSNQDCSSELQFQKSCGSIYMFYW